MHLIFNINIKLHKTKSNNLLLLLKVLIGIVKIINLFSTVDKRITLNFESRKYLWVIGVESDQYC